MSILSLLMAAAGNSTSSPVGQQVILTSSTFTVPPGVTSICFVAVGRGAYGSPSDGNGGGGGALGYKNNVTVTPGQSIAVTINASYTRVTIGSTNYDARAGQVVDGGSRIGPWDGGGSGGSTFVSSDPGFVICGGGGAGGYSGNGGNGGLTSSGAAGSGGGGGGGGGWPGSATRGGGGGGVGLKGIGSNGAAGPSGSGGGGGSGGTTGASGTATGGQGGAYGGGAAGSNDGSYPEPGAGAVRFIWGAGRAFPSTNTGDL